MRHQIAGAVLLTFSLAQNANAQEAVVRSQKTNLRQDPSTIEPPEAILHSGDKLTLIDPTPEHGYLQVKTNDGKEGWVYSKSIHVIVSPSSSNPAGTPHASSASPPAASSCAASQRSIWSAPPSAPGAQKRSWKTWSD